MSFPKPVEYERGDHAVLLLHGLSSSPLELRYLARALKREGFAVSAPVLDGYSAGSPQARMEAWVAASVREFDLLARQYRRVSVCGLSIGAALSIALVHERPSTQALILLSVTLEYDGWAIPWYRFLLDWAYYSPLRHRWKYREGQPFGLRNEQLRAKVAKAMEKNDLSEIGPSTISLPAIHEASRLTKRARVMLPSIKTDTLVIHAIDDETSSPLNARHVVARIGANFLRTVFLDDSYHMITSDNEREIVAREVAIFLRDSQTASAVANGKEAPVVSRALARRLRKMAALAN